MATITRRIATEQDLLAMPKDGQKYELVDGEIRVSPAGDRHSAVALALGARLLSFARTHRLGHVMGADAGFRLPSKNIRSPDVSFVAAGRFPISDESADERQADVPFRAADEHRRRKILRYGRRVVRPRDDHAAAA